MMVCVPVLVYGQQIDPRYVAGVASIVIIFLLFTYASGGGKPHKEKPTLLWIFAVAAAVIGSKAVLDAWNNPLARSLLMMNTPPVHTPYDQSVAKFLVQKLNLDPETAVKDVDIINLWMDAGGAFALLASAAATINYLTLKQQPAKIKVQKKVT